MFIKKQKLTGKFAMNYIQNTLASIRKLGFTKEADKMAQIDFAKYRDISLSTIEYNLLKTFIDVENKKKPCLKDLDTNKHYYVTQDVARVLYLWQVLINSENKFDIRSLKTLDPLESLIILHSILKGELIQCKALIAIPWTNKTQVYSMRKTKWPLSSNPNT